MKEKVSKADQDKIAFELVKKFYKDASGNPFEMSKSQVAIFRAIYEKQSPRVQIECFTQFGKSDVASMAVLTRVSTFPERWIILSGSLKKAKIIMGYLIQHIFDNKYTKGKFKIGKDESLERIKRERSKERITFKVGDQMGEAFILSAEARRRGEDAGDILIGFGCQNLVEDDPALIPDMIHGKAMRMLGGFKDNFLVKIGNSLNRNHFFRSNQNEKYKKIIVDYQQGIKEGRITPEFIEEMQGLLDPVLFNSLYGCIFPGEDQIEEGGWIQLFTEKEIEDAQEREIETAGIKKLGADIGEGGNYNAFVIRTDNYAFVKEKNLEKNLMTTAEKILTIKKEERIGAEDIFVDAVGIGSGVVDRLDQINVAVNAVKSGAKPSEKDKNDPNPIEFYNMRAEMYWKLRQWIKEGGCLQPNEDWKQLTKIKYKESAEKKIKIMSKEEMRRRGIESPDIADSLALTFAPITAPVVSDPGATPPVKPYYPELGF